MRRLIAAAVLIVFVFTAYITGYFIIDSACEKTVELLEKCVTAYEKNENMQLYTAKLDDYWSSKEKTLSVFANHTAIDEIELAIESLSVHSKYPQNEMFYEYSSTLKMLLHQLMEDTVPGMHSIL